jgi:hypothetical protein
MTSTTIRFSQVVEASGLPESYTLWMDPKKDKSFQSALKENRVMTVHQNTTGLKADSGEVGYSNASAGEILIFPKSLKRFEDKKIIGIKYDLLKQPPVDNPPAPKKPAKPGAKKKVKEPKILIHLFTPPKEKAVVPPAVKPSATPKEVEDLKQQIREALEALENDRHVTAYKILKKLVEE